MERGNNQAVLCGQVGGVPQPSHESHGIRYITFPLEVERLSGQVDTINVVAVDSLIEGLYLHEGEQVEVVGEVRSFNNKSGWGSRLVITLYACTIQPSEGEHSNSLVLTGVLCKKPTLRRTPLGREICDMMVAVNRLYGRADYLPCIAWGSLAKHCGALEVGDTISLEGRLQSRGYTKTENGVATQKTAYEVSVMELRDG